MRRRPLRLAAIVLALLAFREEARADDEPVFDGPPELTRYTKELAVEVTGSLTEAGPAAGAGLTVASFYSRWLASFAGATYSPGFAGPRERWEARGGGRLVYPEPLFLGVFGYALAGGGVAFTSASERDETFRRALTGIAGLGLFVNVTARLRLRLEAREHLVLFGRSDTRHSETLGLSFIFLSR